MVTNMATVRNLEVKPDKFTKRKYYYYYYYYYCYYCCYNNNNNNNNITFTIVRSKMFLLRLGFSPITF